MGNRSISTLFALLTACGGGMDNPFGDGSFQDPAGFLAFGSSDRAVTLAWVPVPGATGYMLERASGAADFQPIAAVGATATDYLDTDLTATTYTYRIHAIGDAGISPGLTHTATPTTDAPWITPDEAPVGLPVVQTIGAAGGTIAMADGTTTITIPPQAFASDTQVTVMAIANPIPGDPRPGVDVTFGQDFAQPIGITFASDETAANDLVVVSKQDDGSWVTEHYEVGASTVTMTLAVDDGTRARRNAPKSRSHARVLPPLRSVFLAPRFVRVGVHGHTSFSPLGLFSEFPCANSDPQDQAFCDAFQNVGRLVRTINAKTITQPVGNMDPGYTTRWSVDGVVGGNATSGTIAPTGSYGGFYTAPNTMPATCSHPCRVAVTFDVHDVATGANVTPTRAIVELVPESWVGTSSSESPAAGITTHATVTWNLDTTNTDTTITKYIADAQVTATMTLENCSVVVNWVYVSTDSVMTIDYRLEPPTYTAVGSGSMNVTINCPSGSGNYDLAVGWLPNIQDEPLLVNATEASGHRVLGPETFDWEFHPGS